MTVSLSKYRWDKESEKLKSRLTEAEKIAAVYGNYDLMRKARRSAINDYIDSVPELRRLGHRDKEAIVWWNEVFEIH